MWIIIDCSHGQDFVEIVRDADENPCLFETLDDAEVYAEQIDIGIPQYIQLIV